MGLRNYIISAFCVHNSNGVKALSLNFWKCYSYLRRKWSHLLPVTSPCTVIRKSIWGALAQVFGSYKSALRRRGKVGRRADDAAALYCSLLVSQSRSNS